MCGTGLPKTARVTEKELQLLGVGIHDYRKIAEDPCSNSLLRVTSFTLQEKSQELGYYPESQSKLHMGSAWRLNVVQCRSSYFVLLATTCPLTAKRYDGYDGSPGYTPIFSKLVSVVTHIISE